MAWLILCEQLMDSSTTPLSSKKNQTNKKNILSDFWVIKHIKPVNQTLKNLINEYQKSSYECDDRNRLLCSDDPLFLLPLGFFIILCSGCAIYINAREAE